ncbi:MAG: tetratricopeptide repeat protein [Gammaproteobacteria bacterium]|nr:MAG: tetratricopeptide repeat protein [Gammaproteobacteria bacterium]
MIKKIFQLMLVAGLSACASVDKRDDAASSKVAPPVPSGPITEAIDLIEKNKYLEAKVYLENYVNTMPANWSHRVEDERRVRVFFWDKEQVAECGQYEIAVAGDKKMEPVLDSSYSKAYYLLAFLALESRNNPYDNALLNLDKGLKLEPDQPTLLYEKANLHYRLKRYEQAIQLYTQLTQAKSCLPNVQRARAFRGLGETLTATGKYDDAEMTLYQSLKFDPDNKKAINELDYIDQIRNLNRIKELHANNSTQ